MPTAAPPTTTLWVVKVVSVATVIRFTFTNVSVVATVVLFGPVTVSEFAV